MKIKRNIVLKSLYILPIFVAYLTFLMFPAKIDHDQKKSICNAPKEHCEKIWQQEKVIIEEDQQITIILFSFIIALALCIFMHIKYYGRKGSKVALENQNLQ